MSGGFICDNVPVWMGHNATVLTLAFWDQVTKALRDARSGDIRGRWVAVIHRSAFLDFQSSFDLSAAVMFVADRVTMGAAPLFAFDGFTVYVTDDVPVGDTTGHTNIVGVMQDDTPVSADSHQWHVDKLEHVRRMAVGVEFITRGHP